jgi:hypothetical protein
VRVPRCAACAQDLSPAMWYLAAESAPPYYDPANPALAGVYSFIASFVLYGYLIPISLYVSLEMVKVAQVRAPSLPLPYPNPNPSPSACTCRLNSRPNAARGCPPRTALGFCQDCIRWRLCAPLDLEGAR